MGVADGDTITVLQSGNVQAKVRLAQIDAPEKRQDYGEVSKQSLSDLVFGKPVRVEIESTDRYGRTVGKVLVNGMDANLEQVKRGMAWVYRQYAHDQIYFRAEEQARNGRVGLWSRPDALPPWEFRHGSKSASTGSSATSSRPITQTSAGASCGSKRFCKDMKDCAEARYYLTQCGLKSLDKDGDGMPCESLCR